MTGAVPITRGTQVAQSAVAPGAMAGDAAAAQLRSLQDARSRLSFQLTDPGINSATRARIQNDLRVINAQISAIYNDLPPDARPSGDGIRVTGSPEVYYSTDADAIASATTNQAIRNALLSIGLEQQIDPQTFNARSTGTDVLTSGAVGGLGTQQAQLEAIQAAIARASGTLETTPVTPTPVTVRQVVPPRVGAVGATSPGRVDASTAEGVDPYSASTFTPGALGPAATAGTVGVGGGVGGDFGYNAATYTPGSVERVQAGRTEIADTPIQRALRELALQDLQLGGRLDPETQAEVSRAAFASAAASGLRGGTVEDVRLRDLGLSSIAVQNQRRQFAQGVGAADIDRASQQAAIDAALSQFNAGILSQAALAEYEGALQAGLSNADAINVARRFAAQEAANNARLNAQLEADRQQFNAGAQNQFALTQYQAQQQAGLANMDARNQASQFNSQLEAARRQFNAGQLNSAALAEYEAALRVGLSNAEAANRAILAQAEYNFNASSQNASNDLQAGQFNASQLFDAQRFNSQQSYQAQVDALDRALNALQFGASSLGNMTAQQGSFASQLAQTPRPSFGLDPAAYAGLLVSNINNLNEFNAQQAALDAARENARLYSAGSGAPGTGGVSVRRPGTGPSGPRYNLAGQQINPDGSVVRAGANTQPSMTNSGQGTTTSGGFSSPVQARLDARTSPAGFMQPVGGSYVAPTPALPAGGAYNWSSSVGVAAPGGYFNFTRPLTPSVGFNTPTNNLFTPVGYRSGGGSTSLLPPGYGGG